MAHDPARTEKATPKRRNQARDEGSVLRVADLDTTVLLWANLFLFVGLWSSTFALMGGQVAHFLKRAGAGGLEPNDLGNLAMDIFTVVMKILLPFLGANFLVALLNQVVQHGWKISLKPLKPKIDRLNPASGFKRLFNARALIEILKSLAKLTILGLVARAVLAEHLPIWLGALKFPLSQSIALLQAGLFALYRNILIALVFLAAVDFLYQKYKFEKGIRMTKQEVKDEAKDSEGNPEIKGRQKTLMMQAAMHRIRTAVPQAAVVITNPTHFAVALKYDADTAAPICVAKGVDHLARQIRTIAKDHGIIVVENPPLARALYSSVDLDQPIPPELYQAVAQVLAYVYRLKGAA